MVQYNIIAENEEYTVVSEYQAEYGRTDKYQSEAALEKDYGKAVSFDVRVAGNKETQPRFVTDEDLAAIHMEIETED